MRFFAFSKNGWKKYFLLPVLSMLSAGTSVSGASADWNEKTIRDNLQLVAEWQAKHPKKRSPLHWTYGAFYSGLVQYGLSVPEGRGLPLLRKAGEEQGWKTLNRHYHADDHAVGHAWMEMAMEDGNPAAAEKIRAVLDKVMNRPSSASLQFLTPGCQDRWSWSDALFMSPPVFVKLAAYTGDAVIGSLGIGNTSLPATIFLTGRRACFSGIPAILPFRRQMGKRCSGAGATAG